MADSRIGPMAWLQRAVQSLNPPPPPLAGPNPGSSSTGSGAPAASDGFDAIRQVDSSRRLGARPDNEWWAGRPLSEARNAHRTNTREEFETALRSGANWLEGDVRLEIDRSGVEMRHDRQHERGDNLTLEQWLTLGRDSNRGLKLDVKEPQQMEEILDAVTEVGVPEERLMLNLGFEAMEEWGAEIRARFPNATLAINPPGEGQVGRAEAERMVEQAQRFGGPATFVIREDRLSDEAIPVFRAHGTVSVWGSGVEDLAARTEELKRGGVDGMIDLSSEGGPSVGDRVDAGFQWIRTGLDRLG